MNKRATHQTCRAVGSISLSDTLNARLQYSIRIRRRWSSCSEFPSRTRSAASTISRGFRSRRSTDDIELIFYRLVPLSMTVGPRTLRATVLRTSRTQDRKGAVPHAHTDTVPARTNPRRRRLPATRGPSFALGPRSRRCGDDDRLSNSDTSTYSANPPSGVTSGNNE